MRHLFEAIAHAGKPIRTHNNILKFTQKHYCYRTFCSSSYSFYTHKPARGPARREVRGGGCSSLEFENDIIRFYRTNRNLRLCPGDICRYTTVHVASVPEQCSFGPSARRNLVNFLQVVLSFFFYHGVHNTTVRSLPKSWQRLFKPTWTRE